MIGNDIIDLNLASAQSNWQRLGFLEKQFTKKEQQLIYKSSNSFKMVWLLWSMKESAYKIWAQQEKKRVFAPKKFECKPLKDNKGIVRFNEQNYFTTSQANDLFIYTVASQFEKPVLYNEIGFFTDIDNQIKKKLAKENNILINEIEQIKSSIGAPNYYFKSLALLKSCSISHHGKYGAFSLLF